MVLLPLLPNVLLLLRRKGFQRLVLLARCLPLGRRQLGPRAHLLLDALLLLGRHLRVALRDTPPFLLARGVKLLPVGRERGENLPFGRREGVPRRRPDADRLRERIPGNENRERQSPWKKVGYSKLACFSQFWNPRSR